VGWITGVQFPAGAMKKYFSLCYNIQTGSRSHPASYPIGTEGAFPGSEVARV